MLKMDDVYGVMETRQDLLETFGIDDVEPLQLDEDRLMIAMNRLDVEYKPSFELARCWFALYYAIESGLSLQDSQQAVAEYIRLVVEYAEEIDAITEDREPNGLEAYESFLRKYNLCSDAITKGGKMK